MKIVATNRVFPETRALLPSGATLLAPDGDAPLSREAAMAAAADADALMAFMTDRIDAAFLAACPRLRIVGAALKGYDNIDLEAARDAGVWVTIVEDLLTGPTAELAIALMLTLGRRVLAADADMRRTGFEGWRPRYYGRGLAGETVGLLGYGAVGQAIARRLDGFGCRLLASDRTTPADGRVEAVGFDALLAESDWLVLALPLTSETTGVIDRAEMARLKPGAMLINPARGSLVNEAAVADALETGRLGGYAADVFECEDWARADRPAAIEPRLLAHDARTVLTPHIGSAVVGSRRAIEASALRSIMAALAGASPPPGAVAGPERLFAAPSRGPC